MERRWTIAAAAGVAAAAALATAPLWWRPPAPVPAPAWSAAPDPAPATPRATPPAVVVYVAGAVARPGVYRFPPGSRADDAVRRAGGLTAAADPLAVNLAAQLRDGEEIAVRERGAAAPRAARAAPRPRPEPGGPNRRGRRRPVPPADAGALDLNHADAAALASLPGIGPGLAARIVTFRQTNGPFASVDGLADVAGITPRRLETVFPYLTVSPTR